MQILLYLGEGENDIFSLLFPIANGYGVELIQAQIDQQIISRPQGVLISDTLPGGFEGLTQYFASIQIPVYVLTSQRGLGIFNQVRATGGKGIIPITAAAIEFTGIISKMAGTNIFQKPQIKPVIMSNTPGPQARTDVIPHQRPVIQPLMQTPESSRKVAEVRPFSQAQPVHNQHLFPAPEKKFGLGSQIITVFGFKGGIGKSTLSTNLAVKLASYDKPKFSVVIVDFDINAAGRLVNMFHVYPSTTILDWASSKQVEDIADFLVDGPGGIKILPAPRAPHDEAAVTTDVAEKVLKTLSRRFDFVIVDCPMVLRDSTIVALDMATKVILIATPDRPTLQGVCDVAKTFKNLNIESEKINFVLNRVPKQSSFRVEDLGQDIIPYPLVASIQEDPAVQIAINRYPDRRIFACEDAKAKEFQKGFDKLVRVVNPYLNSEPENKGSVFSRFKISFISGRR